jgi:hypothetical protein
MKTQTLITLRRYHTLLGVFFAPAIILFSISGALQTFRLQEEKGYGGTPPNWIVWLSAVHTDQAPPREERPSGETEKPRPAPATTAPKPAAEAQARRPNPLPLKTFVVLMAIGLLTSTLIGLTIALSNRNSRRKYLVALAAGAIAPIVLLWL